MNDSRTHHPEFESLIVRAADGLLDQAERARLDRHLAACDACRDAFTAQTMVRASLQARPLIDASPAFYARVRASVHSPASWLDTLDFRRWTWRLVPVAAALVTAVLAFAGLSLRTDSGASAAESGSAMSANDLPVSSALWSSSMSDDSVISLMLRADADDALSRHVADNNKQQ